MFGTSTQSGYVGLFFFTWNDCYFIWNLDKTAVNAQKCRKKQSS